MSRYASGAIVRYGIAVVATIVATGLRLLLDPYMIEDVPFITYFPAVFIAALYGGLGPTLMAVFLSVLAAARFFMPPAEALLPATTAGWMSLTLFTFFGVAVGLLSEERLRRVRQVLAEREQFSVTLASIGDAVIVTDARGTIHFVNPVAERLTGWKNQEAHGKPLEEVFRIVSEGTRQPMENPVEKVLRMGGIVGLANHTILLARDGTERTIDDSAAPIQQDESGILGVVLVFRDVSAQRALERRRVARLAVTQGLAEERTVERAVDRLLSAVCTALDWDVASYWQFDEKNETLRCEHFWQGKGEGLEDFRSAMLALDATSEHSLPRRVWESRESIWIPDVTGEPNFFRAPQARQSGLHGAFACPVGAGSKFLGVFEFFSHEIRQPDEDLLEMMTTIGGQLGQFIDRRQTERELLESEERFRALADNIPQLAWMTDQDGWIFWYNRRWFEYTGSTLKEMEGWGWQKVHHPEHVQRVTAKFQHHINVGEPWEDTFPLRRYDGEYRWFLSRAFPIRNDRGEITRWFGTNTDVTEQRQSQEELRDLAAQLSEAARRKDEFLATLAHELRNPLAPIRSGLEIMKMQQPQESEQFEELRGTMERQTDQLVALVDDLLDVSRITRGKLQLKKCEVALEQTIRAAIESVQPLLDEANHQLDVELPEQRLMVEADPHRLAQIFSNLLHNASKYTPEGGRIRIALRQENGHAIVSVKDNGIGIPQDRLKSIFEMFSQINSPIERGHVGLGIGLTLVKSLVEMHGGQVEVESAGPNQGSEFRVRLPVLAASQQAEAGDSLASDATSQSRRVLVVDDNKAAAVLLSQVVGMLGHDVQTVSDGVEAVEAAGKFRPEVIIMDIGMPNMNGYEAARRIRREPWGREMMLVALTGWGQEGDRQRSEAAGFDRHLVKPAEPAELKQIFTDLDSAQPPAPA